MIALRNYERGIGGMVCRTFSRRRRPIEEIGGELSRHASELHDAARGSVSTLLKTLGTTLDGLSAAEVRRRASNVGPKGRFPRGGPSMFAFPPLQGAGR